MNSIAKYALENPNDIKNFKKDIRRAIKKAATQTVNAVAFKARGNLKAYVLSNFKNPRSLAARDNLFVTKAAFGHVENLTDIKASVGFSEKVDFMKRQDEGGWHTAKEPGKKLRILTDAAEQNGMTTIHVGKRGKQTIRGKVRRTIFSRPTAQKSRKSARIARAAMAYKTGLLLFSDPHGSLFKVKNFKKEKDTWDKALKKRIYGKVSFDAQMYINRKYERTFTRARNFFKPACESAAQNIQAVFNENMDKISI